MLFEKLETMISICSFEYKYLLSYKFFLKSERMPIYFDVEKQAHKPKLQSKHVSFLETRGRDYQSSEAKEASETENISSIT